MPSGPLRIACVLTLISALGGCSTLTSRGASITPAIGSLSVYENERFQADETYSRLFDASARETCEAARRALLSQGYEISQSATDKIKGQKRFQPEGEVHVEIAFTVVCLPEGNAGKVATAFVSALQDRHIIKKSANSTSVGVSAIGSISLPTSSTVDSLVKVGSETIPAGHFYDRFFALMQSILKDQGEIAASAALPAVGTP